MALILTQTDTAADNGTNIGCSGATIASTPQAREATSGGTAGATELTPDPGNVAARATVMFQSDSDEPGTATWTAGDYVVRLNITSSRMSLQWTETYICERTSGGAFNTVASLTGQTTDLGATGTKTHTVNRATDFSAAADSTLYIVLVMDLNAAHGGTSFGFTPSLNIDTPIEVVTTVTVTATVDSLLQRQDILRTATMDALLQQTFSWEATIDAVLQKQFQLTTEIDSLLQKTLTATTDLDALLQKGFTRTATIDAILEAGLTTQTLTASIDALLQKGFSLTSSLDALLARQFTVTATMDAELTYEANNGVEFDGTGDAITTTSIGTNSKQHMFSMWLKIDSSIDASNVDIINTAGPDYILWKSSSGQLIFWADVTVSGQRAIRINSSQNYDSTDGWLHVLVAVDVSHTDSSKCWMYVNDEDVTSIATYNQQTTNDMIINAAYGFYSDASLGDYFGGGAQELWFPDGGEWLDLSVEANRRKFSTSEGKPTHLGADGSLPTGTQPLIYFNDPYTSYETNKGSVSQSAITLTGTLADEGTKPQYTPPGATLSATIDALLQKQFTLTATVDALLQKSFQVTSTVDALLQKGFTRSATIDAVLTKAAVLTATLDALLQKQGLVLTATMDAVLTKSGTLSATMDALLQKEFTLTSSLDALIQRQGILSTATIDALLQKQFDLTATLDGILKGTLTKTATFDGLLQRQGLTVTATIDAVIQLAGLETHTRSCIIDAILFKAWGTSDDSTGPAWTPKADGSGSWTHETDGGSVTWTHS